MKKTKSSRSSAKKGSGARAKGSAKKGARGPAKKGAKRAAAKKPAVKRAAAKKGAKRAAAKKGAKRAVAKKPAVKRAAAKKPAVKRAAPRKPTVRRAAKHTPPAAPAEAPAVETTAETPAQAAFAFSEPAPVHEPMPAKAPEPTPPSRHGDDFFAAARQSAHRHDDGNAFLPDPEGEPASADDDLAEEMAEDFVTSALSGEESAVEERDEVVDEERGGPFVETSANTEFADDTDSSNPAGAEPAAFPTANRTGDH